MTEYNYETDFGKVTVEEFYPPYSEELIQKIAKLSETHRRKEYTENYETDERTVSIIHLLRSGKMLSFNVGYIDGVFQFFMGTRIAEDTGMFLTCVRIFASITGVKKQIHTSYMLNLQMEFAKRCGYKECSFTMNVGIRDGLAKLVRRRYIDYKHGNVTDVKSKALDVMSHFEYKGIHTINYCEQHLFTAKLD